AGARPATGAGRLDVVPALLRRREAGDGQRRGRAGPVRRPPGQQPGPGAVPAVAAGRPGPEAVPAAGGGRPRAGPGGPRPGRRRLGAGQRQAPTAATGLERDGGPQAGDGLVEAARAGLALALQPGAGGPPDWPRDAGGGDAVVDAADVPG